MRSVIVVFFVVLVLKLLTGCHNYSANVGEVLNCTLAGNGCDDGRTGPQGAAGTPGVNGNSCTVTAVAANPAAPNGGAQILCPDMSSALILNGEPGDDVPMTPYSIVKVITPCPSIAGTHKEILLVLADRSILASVSANTNGKETRLSLLQPGGYITTDGRGCAFTVTSNSITYTGGSESY